MSKRSKVVVKEELAEASVQLQARIERIAHLERRIEDLVHIRGSNDRSAALLTARNEARFRVRLAEQKLGTASPEQRASFEAALRAAQKEFAGADLAYRENQETVESIRAELTAAQEELTQLKSGCGVEEALAFQHSLAEAEQRVPELKALVAEQERIIAEAQASVPSATELLERREDILAGIATGDATEAELKAVDKELENLNARIADASAKASEVMATAGPRLAGLQRMLKDAEQRLGKLKEQKPEVTRQFLKTQAALVYGDYLKLAHQLGEKFVQLMSLNALICEVPERRRVDHSILLMAFTMKIPRFKVGPDREAPSMSTVFDATQQRIDIAKEAERQRLIEEGVTLLG